ncbi:MAG: tol-pal system protein YbgF [Pseudomonadota bacterium]
MTRRLDREPLTGQPIVGTGLAAVVLAACVSALAATLAPSAVFAQAREWVNPNVMALQDRVSRLESEIAALRGGGGVVSGGGTGAPLTGDAYQRLTVIDQELRRMTGDLERLQFELRRQEQQNQARMADMQFRLESLEARIGGGPPPQRPQGTGGSLQEPLGQNSLGQNSLGQGSIGQGSGSQGSLGGQPAPAPADAQAGTRSPDLYSSLGRPEGTLGRLETTDPNAASRAGQAPIYEGNRAASPAPAVPTEQLGDEDSFRQALETLRQDDIDTAQAQFQSYVTRFPNSGRTGDAYYWLGEIYYVRQRYDQAATAYLTSFRDHPNALRAPDSLLKLGITMNALGRSEEACLTFQQLTKRFPDASNSVKNRTRAEAERAGCS